MRGGRLWCRRGWMVGDFHETGWFPDRIEYEGRRVLIALVETSGDLDRILSGGT